MFRVLGAPIMADEADVLIELRAQLELNGIHRFHTIRRTGNYLQFNCPFHKGGMESKPSCGIATVDIKQGDRIVKSGTVHCFTCGKVSTLEEMISFCFGKNDMGAFGIDWLRKNFLTVKYEERPELKLDFSRNRNSSKILLPNKNTDDIENIKYISEEELDSYRYIHPYMYQRKLTDDIIEMFDVGYDNDFVIDRKDGTKGHLHCITFPVRDEQGRTLFIARRSVDTKFFHYPMGAIKPVYGLYELAKVNPYPMEVIICESIFNCLTCWVYGKHAVALNGTGNDYQYKQLRKMKTRKFILGLDPDDAGYKGRVKLHKHLGDMKVLTEYDIPTGKDINDLTYDEFISLPEHM